MRRKYPAASFLLCCVAAVLAAGCPTLDMSGTYVGLDPPWDRPVIEISTYFPLPFFEGTYRWMVWSYPISGTISSENELLFSLPYDEGEPSYPARCSGFDDGSSIWPGSGQTPEDGKADRLACRIGVEPVTEFEIWKVDWF